MLNWRRPSLILAAVSSLWCPLAPGAPAFAQVQAPRTVKMPAPGVPEVITLKGKFLRVAYNDEGFVVLGYMSANRAIGGEWMLLEVGTTLLDKRPNYTLTRDAISLETPDGRSIPLASVNEHRAGATEKLQWRATRENPSILYFPTFASELCRIPFFADVDSPATVFDEVELSTRRGCIGRIYFRIPGGIALGQHWLNVKFAASVVRVPFTILTPAEEQYLQENFKDIQKQVEEAFPPTR